MSTESDHHHPQSEGHVVCPKCLLSNSASAAFCADCGAPIGMVATVDPIQSIHAEGFGYRAAIEGPPSRVILTGMWLVFGSMALMGPSALVGGAGMPVIQVIIFNLWSACSIVILYRTTRNYIVKSRLADARGS